MKKIYFVFFLFIPFFSFSQQILTGEQANTLAPGSNLLRISGFSKIPDYIGFSEGNEISLQQVIPYLQQHFKMNSAMAFNLLNVASDKLGFTHYRYQQTFNGIPLQGSMYMVHVKNGKVVSMNGMIFPTINSKATAILSEKDALQFALNYVHASVYRWQVPEDEQLLKAMTKNANATWYPKGELTYAPLAGTYSAENYRLTYSFDIFATQPFSRQYIYIDAQNGQVVFALNRVESNNPTYGTAITAYSGPKTIVTDSEGTDRFYLRDSLRGHGVITRNIHHSTTNYAGATNFQDSDNVWNNVNAELDQYATDAHLGLEKTYDFYDSTYGRNSLDGNGIELFGYVHYDNNLVNANWDGFEMNFGDGNLSQGITPLTTLDITGHEMTHGVTQYTCNLNYAGESGGLNESFSDCAGEMVERLGKGVNDWLVGAEIGTTLRYFSNPSLDGASASSYQDKNWYMFTDVHFWSGVQNHWFYILSVGGKDTNDLGVPYNVRGIGIDDAHAIAYRNQSVYLVPSSQYADARFYSIIAAKDLFGGCSQQDISCANAWHAVGVGDTFKMGVQADFLAPVTALCAPNNKVIFTNLSNNGQTFLWNLGDSTITTDVNPVHTYTTPGTYSVSLSVNGGACGSDSIQKVDYITLNFLQDPVVPDSTSTCVRSPALLTGVSSGDIISWYDAANGGNKLGAGDTFYTAPVFGSSVFYAENDDTAAIQSAGPPDNTFGTGGYFTNTNAHYLFFDAYDNFTLESVTVYSSIAATRTIVLYDASGILVDSSVQAIGSGMQNVVLNFHVPAGSGYQLGLLDGSTVRLYRNQTGANYPYSIPGLLSITGSDAGPLYYYYFYNWQVRKDPCASLRVPVKVSVRPTPIALFSYTLNGQTVTFSNGTVGASVGYEWLFGDGTTSTETNPVHEYATAANYTVTLIACTSDCCDTISKVIEMVTGVPAINNEIRISVSPNPFTDQIRINYNSSHGSMAEIEVTDLLGRTLAFRKEYVLGGEQYSELDTKQIPSGVYLVHIRKENQSQIFKVIKQR